jgi:hypothetical protein
MSSRLSLVFCGVFLVVGVGLSGAQEIVGTRWVSNEHSLQMRLEPDGTYAFVGPGFSSSGWYQLNGQFLLMQDGANGVQSMYQLSAPSPGVLVLTDATGMSLQMKAAGAEEGTPSSPSGVQESSGDEVVLATVGDQRLTTTQMQVGYDLAELVIDQRLTQVEKERLISASIEEFSASPEEFLRQINELKGTMTQLQAIQDPFMLGLARQTLFAQFYLAVKDLPSDQVPELITIMQEHLRVVAEDPETQLVLTSRDLQAMVEYNQFVAQLTGMDANPSMSIDGMLENQLQESFPSLPLETKQTLAAMYPVWQATQYSWAQMNDQQRRQVVMQMRQQNAQVPSWDNYGAATQPSTEAPSEWGQTSTGSMALEMMRSANNARIMSAVIDTNAGFTACLTCSPGINPYK